MYCYYSLSIFAWLYGALNMYKFAALFRSTNSKEHFIHSHSQISACYLKDRPITEKQEPQINLYSCQEWDDILSWMVVQTTLTPPVLHFQILSLPLNFLTKYNSFLKNPWFLLKYKILYTHSNSFINYVPSILSQLKGDSL